MVHALSLVVGYAGLLVLQRGTWFRGDDFEILANRVGPQPRYSLWMPHNEHWLTGPILIWRVLYDTFGMSSVLPYLAVSLAAHTLTAHLLWRVMRRVGVGDWVATGLAATFVVLGAGWDNIVWAFQLAFIGSCALGLLSLLLLARGTRPAFVAAVVVSVVSLTFSGISVVFVGMGVVYLLATRRRGWAAVHLLVSGGVYLSWYALAGRAGARPPHSETLSARAAGAAPWAWRALTSALEALASAPGAGWLLLVGLVLAVAHHLRDRWRADVLPPSVRGLLIALVVGLVAQLGSLAVQRDDISTPDTPRYLYIVVALLLPLIGLALSGVPQRAGRALVGLFLAYLVVTQGIVLVSQERPLESPQLQADVLGYATLLQHGEQVYPTTLTTDVDQRSIDTWAATGKLGPLAAVPAQAVSDARALTQVQVVPAAPGGAAAGGIAPAPGQALSGRCETTTTTTGALAATLALGPARTVSVMAPSGGHVGFQVVGHGPASRLLSVPIDPHRTYWFTASRPLSVQVVAGEGQTLTLCAGGS